MRGGLTKHQKSRALRQLTGESGDVIEVSRDFAAITGRSLLDSVLIGPLIGSGLQGSVFRLDFSDGTPCSWALKALAGRAVASLMPAMRKKPAARDPLKGFMRTGAAVVVGGSRPQFRGLVLELMHGDGVDAILRREDSLADVHYIRRMLSEVFLALAAAQEATNFRHWDLRLANVMEHTPVQDQQGTSSGLTGAGQGLEPEHGPDVCFKMIDFGHAQMKGRKVAGPKDTKLPGVPFTEHCYRLFWVHRHDIFRILMSLQNVIDGRCWPFKDKRDVQQLQELFRQVTGVRLNATFRDTMPKSLPQRSGLIRRTLIRVVSFWHLHNSNVHAREALLLPFFTQPPVAEAI